MLATGSRVFGVFKLVEGTYPAADWVTDQNGQKDISDCQTDARYATQRFSLNTTLTGTFSAGKWLKLYLVVVNDRKWVIGSYGLNALECPNFTYYRI